MHYCGLEKEEDMNPADFVLESMQENNLRPATERVDFATMYKESKFHEDIQQRISVCQSHSHCVTTCGLAGKQFICNAHHTMMYSDLSLMSE